MGCRSGPSRSNAEQQSVKKNCCILAFSSSLGPKLATGSLVFQCFSGRYSDKSSQGRVTAAGNQHLVDVLPLAPRRGQNFPPDTGCLLAFISACVIFAVCSAVFAEARHGAQPEARPLAESLHRLRRGLSAPLGGAAALLRGQAPARLAGRGRRGTAGALLVSFTLRFCWFKPI